MPDYKRKKVRRIGTSKPKQKKIEREDIEMKPTTARKKPPVNKNGSVRVITGKKLIRRRKMKIIATVSLGLVLIFTILQFLLPIGVFEVTGNFLSSIGAGEYPIELFGTETLNTVTKTNYFYVLTNSELNAVSTAGKKIYSVSHGFASPILKTSETRALIFDQNGNKLNIYNLSGQTTNFTTERNILTAAIGRNGTYAVVTDADNYTASVSVYDRNDKLLYEWYSATDLVNNVAISPDGKKIAVSTVSTVNGSLHSKLLVLKFDSPNAVHNKDFSDTVIYSLENSARGLVAVTNEEYVYIKWSNFEQSNYKSDRTLAFSKTSSSGNLVVFNRASNRSDNHILVFSKRGKKISEFDFEGIISDIIMSRGHIYCISDTNVYLFDKKGELISTTPCGFGASKLAAISTNEVAVVSNGSILRLKLNLKEK